jgi:protein-disulfide isomerase
VTRFLLLFVAALLPAVQATLAGAANFRESGSPSAPITLEVYTDYQCPHCREFYLEVLPPLTKEFIATGKVRLVHRDFRLTQFQYSKTATRYANAAGQIGKFEVVARQLFETQPEWSQSGDVDGTVAKVLPPTEIDQVRALVKTDSHLDDSTLRDEAMAINEDHLKATPTVIIVYRGKRDQVSGGMSYPLLKSYLNSKLAE